MDVQFDENSKTILKKVDAIHRDSLINVALAIVSNTGYYKTLTGELSSDISDVVSLSSLSSLDTPEESKEDKQQVATPTKAATDWDSF